MRYQFKGDLVLTPMTVAGGTLNKIINLNWKLNIDVRSQLAGGTIRIYKVNSIMLNHRSISRWYGITSLPDATQELYGTEKFVPTDYTRLGCKNILMPFENFHYFKTRSIGKKQFWGVQVPFLICKINAIGAEFEQSSQIAISMSY